MGRFVKWSLMLACMTLAACSPKVDTQPNEEDVIVQEELDKDQTKDQEADTTEMSTTEVLGEQIIPWSSEKRIQDGDFYELEILGNKENVKLAIEEIYKRNGLQMEEDIQKLSPIEQFNVGILKFRLRSLADELFNPDYLKTGIYSSNYTAYDAEAPVEVDLDGDGTLEKVMYTLTYPDQDNAYKVLYVNDTLYEVKLSCSPLPQFAIVDIDTSDTYKEIVISDYGPSDDYKSSIYRYKDGNLEEVGWVEGLFDEGLGIDGKGNVMAHTRSQILQTWYMDVPYALVDGTLEVSSDIFTTNHPVFLQAPLPVFADHDAKSQMFIIKEGVNAVLTATDNKTWCRIETEDGQVGWFRLDEKGRLVDSEIGPIGIFAGLTFYD
ncbi:MAG: hypothetical protein ACRCWY_08905 [Cellulosilyticaceae bacterium]